MILNFWKKQRLLFKLIFIILMSILLTGIVLYTLLSRQLYSSTLEEQENHLLQIARHLANQENIQQALEAQDTNEELQEYTLSVSDEFSLDYTVIMTNESIRLTHPNESLINQLFQGSDEQRVFEGEEYTSTAQGTLGQSLRAFVPVYNSNNEILGAVSLGITTQSLQQTVRENRDSLTYAFLISSILGVGLAFVVAYSLKKQMHDMEPQEIARVLKERNAMMEYAKDAIFATNAHGKIILANQEAKKRFVRSESDLSQPIQVLLPFIKDMPINKQTTENVCEYNEKHYVVSIAPIVLKDQFLGNIYSLRDATELNSLLDQLYTTSNYAKSLQSQSHDFLNKLHVIYGLTDLEEYEELKHYLANLLEPEEEFTKRIAYLIHEPVIAGFLIGERHKFSENNIPFTIEIYPDIPAASDPSAIQQWIQQIREINHLLLLQKNVEDLHIELGYYTDTLFSTFQVKGKNDMIQSLTNKLNNIDGKIQYGKHWIKISFSYSYDVNKENIFDGGEK